MKTSPFAKIMPFALVLSLVVSGCHKKHTAGLTPLPGKGGMTGENPTPGAGGRLQGTEPSGISSPISSGLSSVPAGAFDKYTPNAEIFKSDTVHFDFDSSVVKPDEGSKVAAVADYLKANAGEAVRIEGHCDERGTEEYNRALGERRALALREELARLGLDPMRVDTISFGKDKPEASGHDESAWKQNRRGVFILLTPPK
jgi:peptidoglycan-associated lipoprotein